MDMTNQINILNNFEGLFKELVKSLNQNQIKSLLANLYSNILWREKNTSLVQVSSLKRFARFCNNLLDNQLIPLELNANGLIKESEFIDFSFFWREKNASISETTKLQVSALKRLALFCSDLLDNQLIPLELNANGLIIEREFTNFTLNKYEEFFNQKNKWNCLLRVNSFKCYWIDYKSMKILCFCEGDLITRTATNIDMLKLEIESILKWHIENS
jgi:hypothetical protein